MVSDLRTELTLKKKGREMPPNPLIFLVGRGGIEPPMFSYVRKCCQQMFVIDKTALLAYNQDKIMPTVLRHGPYRFYFYSHETTEPPHIHVDRENLSAKFWLQPISLARNFGFSPKELREIQSIILENQSKLLEAWYGYFGTGSR